MPLLDLPRPETKPNRPPRPKRATKNTRRRKKARMQKKKTTGHFFFFPTSFFSRLCKQREPFSEHPARMPPSAAAAPFFRSPFCQSVCLPSFGLRASASGNLSPKGRGEQEGSERKKKSAGGGDGDGHSQRHGGDDESFFFPKGKKKVPWSRERHRRGGYVDLFGQRGQQRKQRIKGKKRERGGSVRPTDVLAPFR